MTRRSARLEALILVEDTAPVRAALARFYGGLGLPFRPSGWPICPRSAGRGRCSCREVRGRYGAEEGTVGSGTVEKAVALRERWRFIPESGSSL
ncbi:hypothetical protein GBA63_07030 [Rubrobacter tropicus]|uniref:Uncharacterized protein n=1 Tax=Rubrobacter tropicus TaxID=2653851 RepID=A0A6G8Q7L0_9ACTN|nr:hypothetical protein [Rubrobacter tropicus]QIN82429.1 hypothetical protein GBA63_07030 [Rubrobacter tropicus]